MSDDNKKISLPIVGDEDNDQAQQDQQDSASLEGVQAEIDREINENDVVLYMKGTPRQPMCGFSARAAQILQAYGVDFHAVNILQEADKREGIKEYGDWPTIPQLYIGGELVGGSDIMMKMHESGDLADTLEQAGVDTKTS